jgi:hypothetical protein
VKRAFSGDKRKEEISKGLQMPQITSLIKDIVGTKKKSRRKNETWTQFEKIS